VILQKYFSHPSLVIYIFLTNLAHKTNSKPSGLIIMMGQSETLSSSSQIQFITLFFSARVHTPLLCLLLPAIYRTLCNSAEPKPIS